MGEVKSGGGRGGSSPSGEAEFCNSKGGRKRAPEEGKLLILRKPVVPNLHG